MVVDKNKIIKTLEKLKESSKKRKFIQSVDLIVKFKGIDLKKPENRRKGILFLPKGRGKEAKVLVIIPKRLESYVKNADRILYEEDLPNISKREAKKIGKNYDFILAYIDSVPKIARYIGRYLGPRGKIPDAKYGMIIKDINEFEKKIELFKQKAVRYNIKDNPSVGILVGSENMSFEDIADNIDYVIERFSELYPEKEKNIEKIYVKLTMSKSIKL